MTILVQSDILIVSIMEDILLYLVSVQNGERNRTKGKKDMDDKVRRRTVACIVTEHDQAVIKALAFLRKTTISDVLCAWIKPLIDEAAETPEVKKLLGIREQEGTRS